ncbi:uncharacterized protein [Haliotis asinina]|uniref:uncharacterized protein n=1 Tax=Haliotis asinina TaxID=109174 RepID=UPI003532257B
MWGLLYKGKKLFNPYRHFGQPTLWPRGYPLGSVGENITQEYELSHWKTPSIQQGIVNGDPDMDAIFRLTRKHTHSRLNVTFDDRAPPAIVPAGVFSPFNSQNTLFLYDALWALLIPSTTTVRVCDIWRGYWAQRLLWEMGGNLGFLPPNAFQKRNSHSYLSDAKDENDLYYQTERLVDFLSKWRCSLNKTFFDCMAELSTAMVQENFWREQDARLTYLWIQDLKALGYKEPKRIPLGLLKKGAMFQKQSNLPYQTDLTDQHFNVTFWAAEQTPPMIYSTVKASPAFTPQLGEIISYCGHQLVETSKIPATNPNLLLIVVFNTPYYQNLRFLETMYGTHFPNIVYCGINKDLFYAYSKPLRKPLSFIELDTSEGWFGHQCLILAMKLQFRVDGYLYIGDDVLLNPWNIHVSPLNSLWVYQSRIVKQSEPLHWDRLEDPKVGLKAYQAALRALKLVDRKRYTSFTKMLSKNSGHNDGFFIGASDIVYVPQRYKGDFLYYMEHFSKFNLYLEIIFPTVLRGIEILKNVYEMPGTYFMDGNLNQTEKYFDEKGLFLHTVKLSKFVPSPEGKKFFCEKFFPLILYG